MEDLVKDLVKDLEAVEGYDILKDIKTIMQSEKYDDICQDFDFWSFVTDWGIADDETIEDRVRYELDTSGWQRICYFLKDIKYTDNDYYYIDVYGNAYDLTEKQEQEFQTDLINALKEKYLEEE